MMYDFMQRWTVFPDMHGQYECGARAVDFHYDTTDMFLFDGDIFNGPDSYRLIQFIRSLGEKAVVTAGNHEWVTRNATADEDDELADIWATQIWPGYEERSLLSFGVHQSPDWRKNAELFKEKLREDGTLQWLRSLAPYVETPEFIAVHAGPQLDTPWQKQAEYLDFASLRENRLTEEPPQIFGGKLGKVVDVPELVDSRTFITGHLHYNLPIDQRTAIRKVCLASPLDRGAPLYTYTSEDRRIHEHAI